MARGISIPFEAADMIVVASLKEQREYLIEDLEQWKNGSWMHPEDVIKTDRLIPMLEEIIKYYGGVVDE